MPKALERLHELLRSAVIEKGAGYPPEAVSVVLEDILESYVETAEICTGATFSNMNLDEHLKYARKLETDDNELGLAAFGYCSAGIMALGQRNPAAAEYFRKAGEVRLKQLQLECKSGSSYDKIMAIKEKPTYPSSTDRDIMHHLADLAKRDIRIADNAETAFKLLYESVDALKESEAYEALVLRARAEIIKIRGDNTEKLRRVGLSSHDTIGFVVAVGGNSGDSVRGVKP